MTNHQGKGSTPVNLRALEMIRAGFADSLLTQEQLAARASVPRSTLANVLSPNAAPRLMSVDWFVRVALALDLSPADLVDELEALVRPEPSAGLRPVERAARSPRKRT